MKRTFLLVALSFLFSCQKEVVDTPDKREQIVDLKKVSLYKQDLFSALGRIQTGADAIFRNEARGFSAEVLEADALSLLSREGVYFREFLLSVGVLQSECDEIDVYPGGLAVLAMAIYEVQMRQYSSQQGLRRITFNEALGCVGSTLTGLEVGSIFSRGLVGRALVRSLVGLVGGAMARAALGPIPLVATVALMTYCLYEADQSYTAVCPVPTTRDSLFTTSGTIPDWAFPRRDSVKVDSVKPVLGETMSGTSGVQAIPDWALSRLDSPKYKVDPSRYSGVI